MTNIIPNTTLLKRRIQKELELSDIDDEDLEVRLYRTILEWRANL